MREDRAMRAMVLENVGRPLQLQDIPVPKPGPGQVLLKVGACGICRTDLHIFDGELPRPDLPLIMGHEIVGEVTRLGAGVHGLEKGQRVGIPWLGHTCGRCRYCLDGQENLCDHAVFTGYQRNGGYAEYAVADARYCFPMPGPMTDEQAAPLLCAGLIGYRAYRLAGRVRRLGLYGFGAAAHILLQVARYQGAEVFAFTRPRDDRKQVFARKLGAVWAGGSEDSPPELLDAAIIFAPAGKLVPLALQAVRKGGRVVCAGIHMSEIPALPYRILWEERQIISVANLTRRDGEEFLTLAPRIPIRTSTDTLALEDAGRGLERLRAGDVRGALVLRP